MTAIAFVDKKEIEARVKTRMVVKQFVHERLYDHIICGYLFGGVDGSNMGDISRIFTSCLRPPINFRHTKPKDFDKLIKRSTGGFICEECSANCSRLWSVFDERWWRGTFIPGVQLLCTRCHGKRAKHLVPAPPQWALLHLDI
jgi:hypothetical protein